MDLWDWFFICRPRNFHTPMIGQGKIYYCKYCSIECTWLYKMEELTPWECNDMSDAKQKIYIDAKNQWGQHSQILAAIEELNEAAAALARFENNKCNLDSVHEELADAEIMLEQMKLYFDGAEIEAWKQRKLKRLKERLEQSMKAQRDGRHL